MKKRACLALALTFGGALIPLFSQPVNPISRGNGRFYFQFANIYFEVDSTFGGRVSSLKVDNKELLFLDRAYPAGPYWGSTFWLSPQDGNHSPAPVERNAYFGGIANSQVVLTSQNVTLPTAKVIKRYHANLDDTSVTITCKIINIGATAFSRAGWEVTRVMPENSLTFWPTGDTVWGSLAQKIVNQGDLSWYPFAANHPATGTKFFADGKEGWYGHVTGDRVLFVKKYTEVPRASQAPNESEIEFWLSGDHKYVELENQSAYRLINPQDSLVYTVKWFLRKLPAGLAATVGSPSLVQYSRSTARIVPVSSRQLAQRKTSSSNHPSHSRKLWINQDGRRSIQEGQDLFNARGESMRIPNTGEK